MPAKRRRSEDEHSDHDGEEVDQVVESDAESVAAPEAEASKSKADNRPAEPPKKRRGRPPGSKNKKTLAAEAAAAGVPAPPPPTKRPRGRPRKPRTEVELEAERQQALMPKRPRGRPPKRPRLDGSSTLPIPNGASGASTSTIAVAGPSTSRKSRGSTKKRE